MGNLERGFAAVFGLFLLAIGIHVLLFGHTALRWRLGDGMVLAVLGANMLLAAYRRQPSWLSRIEPLP